MGKVEKRIQRVWLWRRPIFEGPQVLTSAFFFLISTKKIMLAWLWLGGLRREKRLRLLLAHFFWQLLTTKGGDHK